MYCSQEMHNMVILVFFLQTVLYVCDGHPVSQTGHTMLDVPVGLHVSHQSLVSLYTVIKIKYIYVYLYTHKQFIRTHACMHVHTLHLFHCMPHDKMK